jgi:hypothetical protein
LIGKPVNDIDTPALVIDMDAMKRNLARMAEFAKKHNIRWRPHAKLHKSATLAKMQIRAGAVGVCVQKTSEAEIMVAGGVTTSTSAMKSSPPPSWRAWPRSRKSRGPGRPARHRGRQHRRRDPPGAGHDRGAQCNTGAPP